MKLNEAIINIRVELQNAKLKQSGKNKFAGFTYYELSDFLPKLNELMLKYKVNDHIVIGKDYAELTLHLGEEKQTYTMPFVIYDTPKNKNGSDSMQHIQYLGALNTYYKRYLYLNAFGITDGEVIDAMEQPQHQVQQRQPQQQAVTIDSVKKLAQVKNIPMENICKGYNIQTIEHATSQELNKIYNQLLAK